MNWTNVLGKLERAVSEKESQSTHFWYAVLGRISPNSAGTVIFHETDLTKWKTLEAAFEKAKTEFGKINIVVNNAGIVETSSWTNDNDPREDMCDYLVLNVDLTAVAKGSRLAIQYFAENRDVGEGVVISTSSLYGLFNSGIVPLYAAAKAGVVSLVRSHAMQKEYTNTRHVAICPWFVDTPLLEDHFRGALAHNNVVLIQPERVVEAFVMAIENDDLNGKGPFRKNWWKTVNHVFKTLISTLPL